MLEAKANLWDFPAEYRVVTTNGVTNIDSELVMGAGVALGAKQRFPDLPYKLGLWVEEYGNRPFLCREEGLISLPTKRHWKEDSDIELIVKSVKLLVAMVDKYGIQSVVMPRPGCGNGNLDWDSVRSRIEPLLDDRFTVVS